jgi:hypothetical protein
MSRFNVLRHFVLVPTTVFVVALSNRLYGDEAADKADKPDEPKVVKLTVYPMRPPAAALEHPLLPRYLDLNPGNAALLYSKAIILMADRKDPNEFWDKTDRWLEMPPGELPRGDVERAIVSHANAMKIVEQAAHRDHCDWQPPVHEDPDIFGILLPEMSHLRNAGRLLALKARLEIAEGRPTEALATLQTGYALAIHAGQCPFLVCNLVGVAISGMMDEQMLALVQSPRCPNVYWSLTALPSPLVDLRPGLAFESDSLLLWFPELKGIERQEHTPEEWGELLARFATRWKQMANMVGDGNSINHLGMTAIMTARAIGMLGQVKADLVASGRDPKSVDAMPATQLVLLHMMLVYRQVRDEEFKWFSVPYWQAHEGMAAVNKKLGKDLRKREVIPVASLLLPALSLSRQASVRSDRRIAMLRVIEALRLHAAETGGKLPASLDEIKEVPLPLDPVTGKPFGYKLADGKATLDAPPPSGEKWETLGARYEIMIAAKK